MSVHFARSHTVARSCTPDRVKGGGNSAAGWLVGIACCLQQYYLRGEMRLHGIKSLGMAARTS